MICRRAICFRYVDFPLYRFPVYIIGKRIKNGERFIPDECTTFAPGTMINANVKRNPNPNLNLYPTSNQKPNHYPHSKSLLSEIPLQKYESIVAGANVGSPTQISTSSVKVKAFQKRLMMSKTVKRICYCIFFFFLNTYILIFNNFDYTDQQSF